MAAVNYAEVFQQALGQKFTVGVKFSDLYDAGGTSTGYFRFVGGKTIQIPVLTVTGMVDTDRDSITTATRKVDNAWEPKQLAHDRTFRTLVDPQDIDETNMTMSIANITRVFVTEELFPEMDKYMASKLYYEIDEHESEEINEDAVATSANVLAVFDKFMENMDEAEVPEDGRILYVTPAINTLIKEALTNSRQLGTTAANENVNRVVSMLDNVKRVTVPSGRMKSAYDFTTGAVADGVQINMVLVHPKAVIAPIKVDSVYIDEPSATTDGKHLYMQRMYWDVFVLNQKAGGVQINADEVPE